MIYWTHEDKIKRHISLRFPPMIWFGIIGLAFALFRFENFMYFRIGDSADLFIMIYFVSGFIKVWKTYPNTICGCCGQELGD